MTAGSTTDALPIVAVVGPTASGKSALALALAERFDGEVVNADAFQLYRGMDIGTAKPTSAEQARAPHHCLDVWDIAEPASVAEYQQLARTAISDIAARGRLPIVVGGSALYVRAVCDVLDIPPRDPEVRDRLQRLADEIGGVAMHERLVQVDPEAARHIDPRNTRRIVRALEVVELTGAFAARLPEPRPWRPTLWLAAQRTRPELDERITDRAAVMWRAGFAAEVAALTAKGLAAAPTASKAVGYQQGLAELGGTMSREEAIADTVRATRVLARRQERTFRSDERVAWLPARSALSDASERVAHHQRTRR
ncbi:MAG: tRNA (adenosine(37)-N6)-dimethylallyltransferase MiaA [Candidatus Nanopelagicales bacterium]